MYPAFCNLKDPSAVTLCYGDDSQFKKFKAGGLAGAVFPVNIIVLTLFPLQQRVDTPLTQTTLYIVMLKHLV